MVARHRESPGQPLLLAESRLPPDASSAPEARALVRLALSGRLDPGILHTVELLTSEVVTNAIVHARTPCQLRLTEPRAGILRVEVSDEAGAQPPLTSAALDTSAHTGRGLGLVEALAAAWGSVKEPPGKTIWLEVHTNPAPGTGD